MNMSKSDILKKIANIFLYERKHEQEVLYNKLWNEIDGIGGLGAVYDSYYENYESLRVQSLFTSIMVTTTFASFVPFNSQPILDVGCGSGFPSYILSMQGYGPFVGIDISQSGLDIANDYDFYSELHLMDIKKGLNFKDNSFGAIIVAGVITPSFGITADIFKEFIRVAKPNAYVVISLRTSAPWYNSWKLVLDQLIEEDKWISIFTTPDYSTDRQNHISNKTSQIIILQVT